MGSRFEALARAAGRDRDASRVIVGVLRAASGVGQALERALEAAGLTLPQFNVLMELATGPPDGLSLNQLSERLVGSPPSTSWLTTRMRESGLVTKRRHARDGRVVLIALAEPGWAALERALPLVSAAEAELLAGHDRVELARMARLLGDLSGP